jgi:diguanylate cyclase (GGDEF)-like protein/PAS domain S-box-containing protein
MSLKTKLFIFMCGLFLFFSASVWMYSSVLVEQLNEKWAVRFVKKQILFDKHRTLLPIVREIALVKKMAHEADLLAFAHNENDEALKEKAMNVLEGYRLKFHDRSYFAAFSGSGNYYFNDQKEHYTGKELRYTLSSQNPDDSWFFYAISKGDDYQINVNKDSNLGIIKVWVDFLLKHEGKTVGVVGTGFEFEQFLNESVGLEQDGVRNFFINKDLAIQLARDTTLIDYASMTKADGQHKTIDQFVNKDDLKAIQNQMHSLLLHPEAIKTLWIDFEGKKRLLGMAYLKEFGWFSLTFIDPQELILINNMAMMPILSVLFLLSLFAVGYALHRLVLSPLGYLKTTMQKVKEGAYEIELPTVGTDEIASLSRQFQEMLLYVRENNQALEEKIQERTLGLTQSEQKLNTILDTVEAYIYIKDLQYRYVYANKKTCELFGKELEDIIGFEDDFFFGEMAALAIREMDTKVLTLGEKVTQEEVNTTKEGNITKAFLSTKLPLLDKDGRVYALCGISTDITERRKTEELIKELAYHDALTGLPNRRMLDERLHFLLTQSDRSGEFGALMVIDLDNFKPLNDTHGHSAGDILLKQFARRLQESIREGDTVARFGGDEFIIILANLGRERDEAHLHAHRVAEKILLHVSKPYHVSLELENQATRQIEHHCTASIGVTLFQGKDACTDRLFQEADKAMYDAKEKGRARIEFFKERV